MMRPTRILFVMLMACALIAAPVWALAQSQTFQPPEAVNPQNGNPQTGNPTTANSQSFAAAQASLADELWKSGRQPAAGTQGGPTSGVQSSNNNSTQNNAPPLVQSGLRPAMPARLNSPPGSTMTNSQANVSPSNTYSSNAYPSNATQGGATQSNATQPSASQLPIGTYNAAQGPYSAGQSGSSVQQAVGNPANNAQSAVVKASADSPRSQSRTVLQPKSKTEDAASSKSNGGTAKMLVSIISSLIIVIGLFLGVALLYRKSISATLGKGLPKNVVQVLGKTTIAPRQQLVLVRFGSKLVLVSMLQGEARTLSEITDPLEVDQLAGFCESGQAGSMASSFREILVQGVKS